MIKIKKGKAPDFLLGKTIKNRIKKVLKEKNKHNFSYDNKKKEVRNKLKKDFKNKCCYCERDEVGGVELQIEHFRPKKAVKECKKNKENFGYYWLAYDWDNLLLSCSTCNKKKGTSFPIGNEKDRIHKPVLDEKGNLKMIKKSLINEKAILFNPELDNAFEHFKFENDGKLISETLKGQKTIEIFKLNNNPLLVARNKILNNYINDFKMYLSKFKEKSIKKEALKDFFNKIFKKIRNRRNRVNTHIFFSYFLYANFEYFIKNKKNIGEQEKKQIIKAYKIFIKNGKL